MTWNFSQNIRDNVLEALSGVKGDNSLKIFGPDIDKLELLAAKAKNILQSVKGIANVGIFHVRGSTHLQFRVDPLKCQKWGVTTADVNNVVSSAVGATAQSTMVEGEKRFDIAIRWPKWRRSNETSILDIPVDIINNQVVLAQGSGFTPNAAGMPCRHPRPAAAWPTRPTRSAARRDSGSATWSRRSARTSTRTPAARSLAPAPRPSTARTASA